MSTVDELVRLHEQEEERLLREVVESGVPDSSARAIAGGVPAEFTSRIDDDDDDDDGRAGGDGGRMSGYESDSDDEDVIGSSSEEERPVRRRPRKKVPKRREAKRGSTVELGKQEDSSDEEMSEKSSEDEDDTWMPRRPVVRAQVGESLISDESSSDEEYEDDGGNYRVNVGEAARGGMRKKEGGARGKRGVERVMDEDVGTDAEAGGRVHALQDEPVTFREVLGAQLLRSHVDKLTGHGQREKHLKELLKSLPNLNKPKLSRERIQSALSGGYFVRLNLGVDHNASMMNDVPLDEQEPMYRMVCAQVVQASSHAAGYEEYTVTADSSMSTHVLRSSLYLLCAIGASMCWFPITARRCRSGDSDGVPGMEEGGGGRVGSGSRN